MFKSKMKIKQNSVKIKKISKIQFNLYSGKEFLTFNYFKLCKI